jgi:hypothetical protein
VIELWMLRHRVGGTDDVFEVGGLVHGCHFLEMARSDVGKRRSPGTGSLRTWGRGRYSVILNRGIRAA